MPLLCIDIGNSFAHVGLVERGEVLERADFATPLVAAADPKVRATVAALAARAEGFAYDSVVPVASVGINRIFEELGFADRCYNLRYDTVRGFGFDYPHPEEVGQDRIANAVALQELFGAPAVCVCVGTATVFDVLTAKGYAGGVIAPGLAMMTDYMHERTAQLPKLDRLHLDTPGAIGKNTVEAMTIGARLGFRGLVRETLGAVVAQLEATGAGKVTVAMTGGNAEILPPDLWPGAHYVHDLALRGLEIAWKRVNG